MEGLEEVCEVALERELAEDEEEVVLALEGMVAKE